MRGWLGEDFAYAGGHHCGQVRPVLWPWLLERGYADRAQFGEVTCWLGRAIHELDQPGERQAALGVLEGLLGPRSYQVTENPCLRIEIGIQELLAVRHRETPARSAAQARP
jgi:hypothetical protein